MKKPILITAIALFVATVLDFAVWRVRISGDLASDEPPFNSITLPLRSLKGDGGIDGGNVWLGIVDSKGATFDFIFCYDNKTNGYSKVFYYPSVPLGIIASHAVPLANPDRARAIALTWLRQNENHDERQEGALNYLSGYSRSILRRFLNWVRWGIFQ
jgi:hypothetical protein